MANQILSGIINGRDVLSMTVSEAKKVVAEFYLQIEIMTVGYSDPHKMDYLCTSALNKCGLGYLA